MPKIFRGWKDIPITLLGIAISLNEGQSVLFSILLGVMMAILFNIFWETLTFVDKELGLTAAAFVGAAFIGLLALLLL